MNNEMINELAALLEKKQEIAVMMEQFCAAVTEYTSCEATAVEERVCDDEYTAFCSWRKSYGDQLLDELEAKPSDERRAQITDELLRLA